MQSLRHHPQQLDALASPDRMPTMITGSRLREAVEHETFIKGGDLSSVEGVKYDLRMGSRVLKQQTASRSI